MQALIDNLKKADLTVVELRKHPCCKRLTVRWRIVKFGEKQSSNFALSKNSQELLQQGHSCSKRRIDRAARRVRSPRSGRAFVSRKA